MSAAKCFAASHNEFALQIIQYGSQFSFSILLSDNREPSLFLIIILENDNTCQSVGEVLENWLEWYLVVSSE